MTHRERLETAWSFREPDRVPIELNLDRIAREHPAAARLVRLTEEHVDTFFGCGGYDWGFLGWPAVHSERVLEDCGEYERIERTISTPAGDFVGVIRRPRFPTGIEDYHWERRYIREPADLERLLSVPLEPRAPLVDNFRRVVEDVGERGLVLVSILHPLGTLVRHAEMEEVYSWFRAEPELMHRFLDVTNTYVAGAVEAMLDAGIGPYFSVCAHEMLIPPWMGRALFEEFVFPYDSRIYLQIRARGGRVRAHCHGNCMQFLERFWEMGIDAIEPLEPPPYADCDLAEAKRLVGDRMMLCGNVPSQDWIFRDPEEVEEQVRVAIEAAAPGGGFALRTTGGGAGTGSVRTPEQLQHTIRCCEVYLEAALKYGRY